MNKEAIFHAAMILLKHGDRLHLEGLEELKRKTLMNDDYGEYHFRAADVLFGLKRVEAIDLLAEVLELEGYWRGWVDPTGSLVRRLILLGREDALRAVLRRLDREEPDGTIQGNDEEKRALHVVFTADATAGMVKVWKRIPFEYNRLAESDVRKARRDEMKAWIQTQFDQVKAGKVSEIVGTSELDHVTERSGHPRIDAPDY